MGVVMTLFHLIWENLSWFNTDKSFNVFACVVKYNQSSGVFTLSDTETQTDADKFTQNPMGICVDVGLCAVWIPPQNSVQPIFIGICVGQREHIIPVNSFDHVGKWINFNYKFYFVVLRWSEVCCHS